MDLLYSVYFSPVWSVLILCTLNPVLLLIELLIRFSFRIGCFDTYSSESFLHLLTSMLFWVSSSSTPLSKSVTYDLHFYLSSFSLWSSIDIILLAIPFWKHCQGQFLNLSDNRGSDLACTRCIRYPSAFCSLLPRPVNSSLGNPL